MGPWKLEVLCQISEDDVNSDDLMKLSGLFEADSFLSLCMLSWNFNLEKYNFSKITFLPGTVIHTCNPSSGG